MALAKGFPALALMSEDDLAQDLAPFAAALESALDPITTNFRRQMVSARRLCSPLAFMVPTGYACHTSRRWCDASPQ